MQDRDRLYIDGAWVPSTGSGTIDVVNATTEDVMGRVPEGTPEDIDRAVKAARQAFETWSATPVEERAKYLQQLQEGLNARMQDSAEGYGQPIKQIFEPFFRLERHHPSPFDAQPQYRSRFEDRLWYWLYVPLIRAVERVSALVGVLQHGRIAVYLIYSFVTLLLLLLIR